MSYLLNEKHSHKAAHRDNSVFEAEDTSPPMPSRPGFTVPMRGQKCRITSSPSLESSPSDLTTAFENIAAAASEFLNFNLS